MERVFLNRLLRQYSDWFGGEFHSYDYPNPELIGNARRRELVATIKVLEALLHRNAAKNEIGSALHIGGSSQVVSGLSAEVEGYESLIRYWLPHCGESLESGREWISPSDLRPEYGNDWDAVRVSGKQLAEIG